MCVMPGMGIPSTRSACPTSAPIKRATAARVSPRGFLHEHAEIGGDQLIAAAAGVQFEAERPEIFDQRRFDEMVHVFGGRGVQPRGIARCALGDLVERRQGVAHFLDGENARRFERARPHAIHRQFVRQQAAVERERPLKLVEQLVGRAVKPPAPQFACRLLFWRGAHFTFASSGIVTGNANRLMKPSASFGL